ncbi:UDP-N-acetylmuramate dehydrogenase [Geothermobacter ehrlichii]|uniref:UDP-N-acetylenolpyruvoylglucosamine reductase n=1 Tax=Geothermobacter ehrlichii TaxID=213224 RepID=A0A5D3WHR2_9BACT|nr:UDP-N-acetylmuramate dehydrogenase [Geothermobacter ehrlichii]TYO96096.1 UDP-N-acetylmuramate dehydrogenase [Geothermobacter ehrlichii]
MNESLRQLFDNLGELGGELRRDEPLAAHCSWRVGGPADLFYQPQRLEQLERAVCLAEAAGVPWLVLGNGSNLLVRDGGVRGLVIETGALNRWRLRDDGGLEAECGVALPELARATAAAGRAGLERLAGIPGTLGAAVAINAGAHGQSVGDAVRQVVVLHEGRRQRRTKAELGFGYRQSAIGDREVVLEILLQLDRKEPAALLEAMRAALDARRQAQAVEGPNAGSVFRNPPDVAAWKLIDDAGLRGLRLGGAMVSERHANFIVNCGDARAAEIEELIERVRQRVKAHSGVALETEIRIVGER